MQSLKKINARAQMKVPLWGLQIEMSNSFRTSLVEAILLYDDALVTAFPIAINYIYEAVAFFSSNIASQIHKLYSYE